MVVGLFFFFPPLDFITFPFPFALKLVDPGNQPGRRQETKDYGEVFKLNVTGDSFGRAVFSYPRAHPL